MIRVASMLLILIPHFTLGQKLIHFSSSACLLDFPVDSVGVQSISTVNQHTIIEVNTFAPCFGDFQGLVMYKDSTITLGFTIKATRVKSKNGQVDQLIEVADCDCPFMFRYELTDMDEFTAHNIRFNPQWQWPSRSKNGAAKKKN